MGTDGEVLGKADRKDKPVARVVGPSWSTKYCGSERNCWGQRGSSPQLRPRFISDAAVWPGLCFLSCVAEGRHGRVSWDCVYWFHDVKPLKR